MFSREPKEIDKLDTSKIKDVLFDSEISSKTASQEQNTKDMSELDYSESEVVSTAEKISKIVAPYFIVLTGLYIYEKAFFLGIILITIGIISLFKISLKDVSVFFENVKKIFRNLR